MKNMFSRAVTYGLIVLVGLLCALPNVLPQAALDKLPSWYAKTQVTLGLDLRGGSYLLMSVDADSLLRDLNTQYLNELSERMRKAGIRTTDRDTSATTITLRPVRPEQLEQITELARTLAAERSDRGTPYAFDTTGGVLRLTVNNVYRDKVVGDATQQSLDVVRRRLDESGLVEPSISRQGNDGIEVQLPGVTEPSHIRELLGTTAKMSFHWVIRAGATYILELPGKTPGETYQLEPTVAMEGRHVSDARVGYDTNTTQPVVNFRLDGEGGRIFGDMTRLNIGRQLAIVLDDVVISAPAIRGVIGGGSGQISGGFTAREASDLAVMLRAGALPAALKVIEERTVGPSLGSDSIRMGMMTGLSGALLVLLFMTLIYGQWGFIACFALAINVGLTFGVLSLLGGTLTLPGIAGIILGLGLAVDANILINERIREETLAGKMARQALEIGFSRAMATIIDSHVTTLVAVSLLVMVGSGPVRGFATAIGIEMLISLFTSVSVTRLLMEWRVQKIGRHTIHIGGLKPLDRLAERFAPGGKVIHFMRAGAAGLVISALLSSASVVLMAHPGMRYGIDFTGGALMEVSSQVANIEDLRAALQSGGESEVAIQEFGGPHDFQLRVPLTATGEAGSAVIDTLKASLLVAVPDAEFSRVDIVGPKVSGNFADTSILAVLGAGLGMGLYLWFRFESHFALAAILTIVLDLTKTIGFFVISGVEFNLTAVAALLALIGYSVNDKVVVFDRIRENILAHPERPLEQVLDESISTTLARTILTSGSVFLSVLPMGIAGGSAVASFALPLLFGVVVGTSSSIFIASPILLRLGRRRERLGLPQVKVVSAEERAAEQARP
ncbi:MAG: protein translocase subunit SecD [Pseudomonadales bacterium]|jgi:SecD/SecF fusion protein|nr:protein translocase subunit SecD [Pseudomonadales bacterium]